MWNIFILSHVGKIALADHALQPHLKTLIEQAIDLDQNKTKKHVILNLIL